MCMISIIFVSHFLKKFECQRLLGVLTNNTILEATRIIPLESKYNIIVSFHGRKNTILIWKPWMLFQATDQSPGQATGGKRRVDSESMVISDKRNWMPSVSATSSAKHPHLSFLSPLQWTLDHCVVKPKTRSIQANYDGYNSSIKTFAACAANVFML